MNGFESRSKSQRLPWNGGKEEKLRRGDESSQDEIVKFYKIK